MPTKNKTENPLLSKNIPPAPSTAPSVETKEELENSDMVGEEQKGKTVERQTVLPSLSLNEVEEKATIELSLYLRPSQDDKIEDLRRAYKKLTHKKITANELMRRLIDRATIDDILMPSKQE